MNLATDPRTAESQIRLLEMFVRAGWMLPEKWVKFMPKPTRLVLVTATEAGPNQGKPTDDFAVKTESGGVCDPRRSVDDYSPGAQWIVRDVQIGDAVQVEVTSGETSEENGGFVVLPPAPYRMPFWLKDKTYRDFSQKGRPPS